MRHTDADTKRLYPGATYRMTVSSDTFKSDFNPTGKISVYLSDEETAGKSAEDIARMFETRFKSKLNDERLSDRIQVIRDGIQYHSVT